jgi:hypothetical protein
LRPQRYDDVHLEPDQLGRQVGQPVDPILRISIVDDNILTLNPPELAQPLPECVEQGRPIGRGRQTKKTYPRHLSRLLRVGGERRGEETHGEDSGECDTPDHHAATAVCGFNTVPTFCQPIAPAANMKFSRGTPRMLPLPGKSARSLRLIDYSPANAPVERLLLGEFVL